MSYSRVSLNDWITSSGRFPERAKSEELTPKVKEMAQDLLDKVNKLMELIQWNDPLDVSSGFRPTAINSKTRGAAKKSGHTIGIAIDILQPKEDNRLGKRIREMQAEDQVLTQCGLMMERIEVTVGKYTSWVHLDTVPRKPRSNEEFRP